MEIKISNYEIRVLQEDCRYAKMEALLEKLLIAKKGFLSGSEEEIDELRNICGDYLAYAGFNENYEATQKGESLENLIDKLFVDSSN